MQLNNYYENGSVWSWSAKILCYNNHQIRRFVLYIRLYRYKYVTIHNYYVKYCCMEYMNRINIL